MNYCNTDKTHLTPEKRGMLEVLVKQSGIDLNRAQAARDIGCSAATITRELKRNSLQQKRINARGFEEYYQIYVAEVAQQFADNRHKSPKRDPERYSADFWKSLKVQLKSRFRQESVDTWCHTYPQQHPNAKVPTTSTVYAYIDANLIDGLINLDLPKKCQRKPKDKPSKPKGFNKKQLGQSIDQRDISVLKREAVGHWELDFVKGAKTKQHAALMTLTERKTRFEILLKVPDFSAATTLQYANKILKAHPDLPFNSITCDNGAEFSRLSELPVSVFYCHAYSSWERGTNENLNGQIREFIPKGRRIEGYSDDYLNSIETALNNRPRKILNYATPLEAWNTR
jgi:IS30 family transposase